MVAESGAGHVHFTQPIEHVRDVSLVMDLDPIAVEDGMNTQAPGHGHIEFNGNGENQINHPVLP